MGAGPDSHVVTGRKARLEEAWARLRTLAHDRKTTLGQSLQFQRFNADLMEEESWINEKMTMVRVYIEGGGERERGVGREKGWGGEGSY